VAGVEIFTLVTCHSALANVTALIVISAIRSDRKEDVGKENRKNSFSFPTISFLLAETMIKANVTARVSRVPRISCSQRFNERL
jgi:hypothetical protein